MTLMPRTVVRLVVAILLVLTALVAIRLGALDRDGPAHDWVSIGDGIPATLYLPFEDDDGGLPYQRPVGERPPVVVIAHGYSADQAVMSPLARSLAEAGYATLTFDFRGHGSNTDRFSGDLVDDVTDVVDWVETSPLVDGSRIAVLGHSMGAGAVLDFATQDERPLAVIPVSGGWQVNDEVVPGNIFLIRADGDPSRIRDRQDEIAEDLTDTDASVVTSEVVGKDHISILFSNTAIREIVEFLDPVMGVDRDGPTPGLDDPRLRAALVYLLLALVVVGLVGLLTARFVDPLPSTATAGGLALVAGALVITVPVMAGGGINVLPLGAGQPVVVQTLLAAAALWGTRALVGRGVVGGRVATWMGEGPWLPLRAVAWPGVATGLGLFILLSPLSIVSHRFVPTPERLVLWGIVTLMALPFFAAFEALVRRGGTWQAVGWGVLGRLILLVVLVAGLAAGVLPSVIALVLPLLIVQYLVLEVFAATCYARGRNPAVIAVVESVFIAWVVVTLTPIG